MAAANSLPTTSALPPTHPLPVTVPPHIIEQRRRRHRRLSRTLDQNRTLQILTILLIYIIVVHYALKFATFLIPHDTRSREEWLDMREGNERVGSGRLGGSVQGVLALSYVISSSSWMYSERRTALTRQHSSSTVVGFKCSAFGSRQRSYATTNPTVNLPTHEVETTGIEINQDVPSNNATIQKRPRIPILSYQSSYVIVSKPSGMTVHANSNRHARWGQSKKSPVLQSIVKKQLCRKVYLVHRLDHRTSGACILGFTSDMARKLHGRLRDENAIKLYVALVRGDLRTIFQRAATSTEDVTIGVDLSLNGDGSVVGRRDSIPSIMSATTEGRYACHLSGEEYNGKLTVDLPITVDGVAKDARTDFYFLSSTSSIAVAGVSYAYSTITASDIVPAFNNSTNANLPYITTSLTLLLCRPKTGRTHQIRKHLQRALNAPINGDVQHGDSRVNRFWRENMF